MHELLLFLDNRKKDSGGNSTNINYSKLRDENKINSFEEQQLFSNIKDTKKVNLIKNLMSTDNYKSLSTKQEAIK